MIIENGVTFIESDDDCRDLIERFGKQTVISLYVDDMIKFSVPDNDTLLEYGFNKKYLSTVRANIKRGKSMTHLKKSNGKIKKQFYGYSLHTIVSEMEATQKPEKKLILKRLCQMFYEAFSAKYKKKFDGVDIDTDPITCGDIVNPAYIKTDWDNNCKIVYSLDTLRKCIATKREYTGFNTNEEGNTVFYYRDVPLGYYISPYTKKQFLYSDVRLVNTKMIK